MTIELADVQSLVLRGYRVLEAHPYQRYAYLRVDGQSAGQAWLAKLLPRVTSCTDFDAQEGPYVLSIAFTHRGLKKFDAPASTWPQAFVEGMAKRADRLGDDGPSAPSRWPGALGRDDVDVLVSIASADEQSVQAGVRDVEAARTAEVVELGHDDAGHLPGRPRGSEHFGFVDGIGQPYVDGSGIDPWPGEGTPEKRDRWDAIKSGEFVLGYELEEGSRPRDVDAFQKNGSYFALRKLSEQVAAFRTYVAKMAKLAGWSEELIGAKMVGRWQSGAPLVSSPHKDDPSLGADPSRNNDFRYTDDKHGHACPFGAHIRRANPRDDPTGPTIRQVRSHRIIRRALPYGPWLPEGTTDDVDRGVMFGVINADLENQFEYVQRSWMNSTLSSRKLSLEADKDPLTGAHDGAGKLLIPGTAKTAFCWELPRFVETRGGDYFFVPSLSALRQLSGASA